MNPSPTVSVIVPTWREVENLPELTRQLFAVLNSQEIDAELIIVDDNSQDGTAEACRRLADVYPLRLITRTDERGLATAVIRGLREASGRYVVVMDADLSHPPSAVPALLTPLRNNTADFVLGSRYVAGGSVDDGWGLFRHLNSRIAGWLAAGLTRVKDPMAGFFALRRPSAVELSRLNPCGYKIGLEILVRTSRRHPVEVPIRFADRQHGVSKLTIREQGLYLQHLIRLYAFRFPQLSRFLLFAAVGLSGLTVDMLAFRMLSLLISQPLARAAAIGTAMTWNYSINRRVTFQKSSSTGSFTQYLKFCSACLIGAVFSWGTSLTLINTTAFFEQHTLGAVAAGAVAGAILNFVVCQSWVFALQKSGQHRRQHSVPTAPNPV